MLPTNNPYQHYKEQSLTTMAPGELLVKLYDELIKQMNVAISSIGERKYDATNNALAKCQEILSTLMGALDMKYAISDDLKQLYAFMSKQLTQANIKKDVRKIRQILPMVKGLRESFDKADKLSRAQQHTVGSGGRAV